MKRADFQFILDKVLNKLSIWGGKLLSLAGKITLVNSVLLALPTYHNTLSLVPKQILIEVEKACRKFIWSKGDGSNGLHYASWDLSCKPKSLGGLGINSCLKKTGPLRAKLAWKYCQEKESLMHKVLFPKYGQIPFENSSRRSRSVSWKLICNGDNFLKPIVRWSIDNGSLVNVLKDT
ncbi:Putative ribonuclease H protein [Dendrobium catenatum]|uniref:Ribonuclease H protein n=1 Tax=Dendrobium catenatum TaxID=906689 RepID=A0A2I0VV42_9ASPA|nr:Putative ribonuclease H protein [Dendrobium catenatum]